MNTYLLCELRWMIFAAVEFQKESSYHAALINSACIHARNLFEFAAKQAGRRNVTPASNSNSIDQREWLTFLNNRVAHLYERESEWSHWPGGLDNRRPDRLVVMARAAINTLEEGCDTLPAGQMRDAYTTLLLAAKHYLDAPTDDNLTVLNALYDDSKDDRP